MTTQDAKQLAGQAGLTRLTEPHLEQLAQSLRNNRQLVQRLPGDLHWSEESALVFRLPIPKEARR